MNTTIIGLIALLTLAWTLFVQRIDGPRVDAVQTQIVSDRPLKYGQKVLGATFQQGEFTGYWYEKEGRLEIMQADQLVETLYLVDEGRAEFHFQRWVRNNN
jgi:hypothetical protein